MEEPTVNTENTNGIVCDFCGRTFADNDTVYTDPGTGKRACKACNKKFKREAREEYLQARNQKRSVFDTVMVAFGAVLFLTIGAIGVTLEDTRLLGVIFLAGGIGYAIWLIVPFVRKRKAAKSEKNGNKTNKK